MIEIAREAVARVAPWHRPRVVPPVLPLARERRAGYEVTYTADGIRRVRIFPGRRDGFALRVTDATGTYPQAGLCPSVAPGTTAWCHEDGTVRVQTTFGRPAFLAGSIRTALPVAGENPGECVLAPGERLYVVSPATFELLAPQLMTLVNRRSSARARPDVASLFGELVARAAVPPERIAGAVITRTG